MKILLLGEYSNVHATLAEGLRALGHEVTVASNGDFWKDYPRDIDLSRKPGRLGGIALLSKIYSLLPRWRGFDVVQIVNPMFLELKAERIAPIFRYLRRHNKHVVLGAYGMDWYWVYTCTYDMPLRYSDFNLGNEVRTNADAVKEQRDWLGTFKEQLNKATAEEADAIVACLYEYQVCYERFFPAKTTFIPLPIKMPMTTADTERRPTRVRIFAGISKGRSEYKGTDIMVRAAEEVVRRHPDRIELVKVEGVPFSQYQQLMEGSDAILDQLYSYTPSMNALLAMSKGIICIGGGEPENYDIIHEERLRPIVNVEPSYEDVVSKIEELVMNPERIPEMKRQSIEYVAKHHDFMKVARQYEALYRSLST